MKADGATQRRASADRGADTALDLQALGHAAKVGDIDPIDGLAFRVIKSYSVNVHIDACSVHTTDADGRVSGFSLFTFHHYTWL